MFCYMGLCPKTKTSWAPMSLSEKCVPEAPGRVAIYVVYSAPIQFIRTRCTEFLRSHFMPLEYGRVVLANNVGTCVGPAARLTEIDSHLTWTPRAQGDANPAR